VRKERVRFVECGAEVEAMSPGVLDVGGEPWRPSSDMRRARYAARTLRRFGATRRSADLLIMYAIHLVHRRDYDHARWFPSVRLSCRQMARYAALRRRLDAAAMEQWLALFEGRLDDWADALS
jgi:hypothetical protein